MTMHSTSKDFTTDQPATLLPGWKAENAKLFSKVTLAMKHELQNTGLFTVEALAELIDRYPEEKYNLCSMGHDLLNPVWRDGYRADVPGEQIIKAIENGRMWLNLRKVHEVDERYARLLRDIYAEFEAKVPGLKTFKHNFGILISSPKASVFYHCDVPGQSLWQIAGRKRVYVYPNHEPFMEQATMEKVVLGTTQEEVPYEPWFDDYAEVYDLAAGDMLHWPLNGPHRVVNEDCMNISVTTEHYTDEIRRSYAVNYANGIIRRYTGMKNLSKDVNGPTVYPKAALALLWRKLNLEKKHKFQKMVDFKPDPKAESGFVDIPAFPKAT